MAARSAMLAFVAGPQAGLNVELRPPGVLLGRGAESDIKLSEEYASRRQVQLAATPEGWVAQNLSPSGTKINGLTFKAGKNVLLATGDVISIGAETEILFVGPETEPLTAMAVYRREKAATRPAPREPAPEAAKEATSEQPPADKPLARPQRNVAPASQPTGAGATKLRKYMIFAAIYAAALVGLVIFLAELRGHREGAGAPQRVDQEQIAAALAEMPKLTGDPVRASECFAEARRLWPGTYDPGDLYRIVQDYQLALAYQGSQTFASPDDERKYRQALGQLTEKVTATYREAYTHERAHRWRDAQELYRQVLAMLPENNMDDPVYQQIVAPIRDRLAEIAGELKG